MSEPEEGEQASVRGREREREREREGEKERGRGEIHWQRGREEHRKPETMLETDTEAAAAAETKRHKVQSKNEKLFERKLAECLNECLRRDSRSCIVLTVIWTSLDSESVNAPVGTAQLERGTWAPKTCLLPRILV
eukprot:3467551-Rhodomonas_salina.1